MKKLIFLIFLLFISSGVLYAESLFLKSGEIIEGKVLKENDRELAVEIPGDKKLILQRKNIIRILYTVDYKKKVYIGKTDNKVIEGYIVEENKEGYTVRNRLYSIDEINIKKSDVVYISKKKIPVAKPVKKEKEKAKKLVKKDSSQWGARLGVMMVENVSSRFFKQDGAGAAFDFFYYGAPLEVELHGYATIKNKGEYFYGSMLFTYQTFNFSSFKIGFSLGMGYNVDNLLDGLRDNTNEEYIKSKNIEALFGLSIRYSDWLRLTFTPAISFYSDVLYRNNTDHSDQTLKRFDLPQPYPIIALEIFFPWNISVRISAVISQNSDKPYNGDFVSASGGGYDQEINLISFTVGYNF